MGIENRLGAWLLSPMAHSLIRDHTDELESPTRDFSTYLKNYPETQATFYFNLSFSIDISKGLIHVVRLILPQMLLGHPLCRNVICGGRSITLLLIGPDVVPEKDNCDQSSGSLGSQDRNLPGDIVWSIPRLESLRSNDIANTETSRDESHANDSLCLSSDVGPSPLIDHDKCRRDCIDQIDSSKLGTFTLGCKRQETTTWDTGYTASHKPCPAIGGKSDSKSHN